MKALPKRKGNTDGGTDCVAGVEGLNESPSQKEGKCEATAGESAGLSLNESPSQKEGKYFCSTTFGSLSKASMKALPKRKGNTSCKYSVDMGRYHASMKALPKRKGNSHPKLARNHAAETGTTREPRGGYTQNYTLQPHLPPHNSLAREETMRATRHVPVTYQVLAHTKTPAGCFLSDPARVLTYERGWRGSGKPD